MNKTEKYDSALYGVAPAIRRVLAFLPDTVKENAEEIRLRANLPLALTVNGQTVFVRKNGEPTDIITRDLLIVSADDIAESFKLLCKSSVYAHEEELKNGFIIMESGHRAGICGTLTENGAMHSVSSVNIRIAREINGAADAVIKGYDGGGLLITGPPGSGKTTVLRDFIRQLSEGVCGKIYRVAVIDSRGEISGSTGGAAQNSLGAASDILLTADKAAGMEIALRTLFPDIIAFDEIGTSEELKRVSESFCAGVNIVTTAHIGSLGDIMRRNVTASLIKSGAVSRVAVLPASHSGKITIINAKELCRSVAV